MNLYNSQKSIVDKLQEQFTSLGLPFTSEDLPEAENKLTAVENPIVYVFYAGSSASPSRSSSVIAQDRKVSFHCSINARNLYGDTGMHAVRDIVEQVLVGFKPRNCQRLSLISDDIGRAENKIWVHTLQFECQTMLVQKDETDPIVVPTFEDMKLKMVDSDTIVVTKPE